MRSNLLQSILILIGLVLVAQLLIQKIGLLPTILLLGFIMLLLAVGHLLASGHPLAGKLAANNASRPLVRLVCLLGGYAMPAPPTSAKADQGGPAPRTPADFDSLNRMWKARILGQDAAIDAVTETVRQAITLRERQSDVPGPRRPLAVLFLVGGEGLGKRTLLESVGRAIYPDGRVTSCPLAQDEDVAARLAQAVQANPCHTMILERLEAASPKSLETLRRIAETGELADPTTGAAVPLGSVVIGLTTTDSKLPERLGAGYLRVVGRAIPFAAPEPIVVAQVVVKLLEAECRHHRLALDYADESIVVDIAGQFEPRYGFGVLAVRVSELLAPEICRAIDHRHDRLALVEDLR
ncbi:MAG: hypothetical protein KF873_12225 [Gemmataceae bacterium]|nr:hypothetical protein [Gemmataceae bacterium]